MTSKKHIASQRTPIYRDVGFVFENIEQSKHAFEPAIFGDLLPIITLIPSSKHFYKSQNLTFLIFLRWGYKCTSAWNDFSWIYNAAIRPLLEGRNSSPDVD